MGVLGKRRRAVAAQDLAADDEDSDAVARALFQRAFEAKFKPLEQPPPTADSKSVDNDNNSNTSDVGENWDGLSEESDAAIEVVQVRDPLSSNNQAAQPVDVKAFMSSRLPTTDQGTGPASKSKRQSKDVDEGEAANLKNDVALQRLLKESHLLNATSYSSTGSDVQGKSRLKALDMRIQDLGGKTSHLTQKNMPISHRRGIVEKAANREQKRRQEAVENGIVLEKAKAAAKSVRPRDIGLGGPNIGRFKDGMLKLSNKDVNGIQRTGSSERGKRKGRGR